MCASQKNACSDASSFLPPKLIPTWDPSFRSRSLQNIHNCRFICRNLLKYLLEVETLCFYSDYKGYIQSPKEQSQETHGSRSQIQKQFNPFVIKWRHSHILPCPTLCLSELSERLILKKINCIIKLSHKSIRKIESTEAQRAIKRVKLLRMHRAVGEEASWTPKHKNLVSPSFQVYCYNQRCSLEAWGLLVMPNQREEQVLC